MKDYKKILEGVMNIINTTEKSDIGFVNICSYIGENCPELAESEDERIRKEIIYHIKNCDDTIDEDTEKRMIAWLENQGEQKPVDKIEPKFKVGDTIRLKGSLAEYTIESISGECYHGKGWGLAISGDNEYELVRHKSVEWSEEDETGLSDALWAIQQARAIAKDENDMGNLWYAEHWLKSLKDRVQPQPRQEWSEEDENINECIQWTLIDKQVKEEEPNKYNREINWLKSLRPQNRWKPSEEQIKVLSDLIAYKERWESSHSLNILRELLDDLKKLRE